MAAQATNLRTEYLTNPLGIDETHPRFSWWIDDPRPGARQTAYRVRVASSPDHLAQNTPDLWDSGQVASNQQAHIAYAGIPLTSRQRDHWDVILWDADGLPGPASAPATFELGLLDHADWSASWITTEVESSGLSLPPAPILRTTFRVERPIRHARLYITALGLHEAHLNGQRVGDDYFRPGWTDYHARLQYQTYDVTAHLTAGDNALAVLLGDGWYSGRVAHLERGMLYGTRPALLAQLEIAHEDGTTTRIVTNNGWRWRVGPIRGQDLLEGEEYDARHEIPHWAEVGCDEQGFAPVLSHDWPDTRLVPAPNAPVRAVKEIAPIADPVQVPGGWSRVAQIFDLGQNIAGIIRLAVHGPRGATLRLRYAEMLDKDGTLYIANLRGTRATDTYTLCGDPDGESWTPRFTFHGFRYVEVSYHQVWQDQLAPLDRSTVTGLVLMSDLPETGTFACSDPLVNQLQANIQWGQRGNFLEIPTDCPQRDERLGWTGDAQVFAPTAAYNFDVAAFFAKWLRDCDDAQRPDGQLTAYVPRLDSEIDGGPGWTDARVLCPWAIYLAYGDTRLLERHYGTMTAWIDWQASTARDGVRCYDDCGYYQGYGDWLALDSTWQSRQGATPKDLIGTAYFAHSADTMQRIATVLGRDADAARFAATRKSAIAGFNRAFVAPSGHLTAPTQTAYLMALAWDLLPEPLRPAALARLLALFAERDWHLSTGFLGTPLICPVLTRFGRADLAYRIFLQQDYPGWLFPVRNGATTMWERWNSWTPDAGFGDATMNSFNHYAYGAIGRWMYDTIAGLALSPTRPGYGHVNIAPQPGGNLTWANASIRSLHGPISTAWTLDGGRFTLTAQLPPNTTATVSLPNGTTHDLPSGTHTLACDL
jgi:alpha-L-rhamnosidase